jgi:hypothetical protein
MYDAIGGAASAVALTLYTDAFQIRGTYLTRQHRVTDMLNHAEDQFLVLGDVTFDEFGSRGSPITAEYAQVNLASVLFAVTDELIESQRELRTPKTPEEALISVPPFKVTGRIHLLPERNLRDALSELHGQFLPVTDATYWSDSLGEARAQAAMVAVNHARAQILAPHRVVDPWAGLERPAGAAAEPSTGWEADPASPPPTDPDGW